MREKTSSSVIRIDYSNDEIRDVVVSKLNKLVEVTNLPYSYKRIYHLTGFEEEILPKPKCRRLDNKSYRIIKNNKSKLIRDKVGDHNIRSWTP